MKTLTLPTLTLALMGMFLFGCTPDYVDARTGDPADDDDSAEPADDDDSTDTGDDDDSTEPDGPVDNDGDGYSPNPDVDCDDEDPDVHPGADEICDNGIDDDCDELIDMDDEECEEPPIDGYTVSVTVGCATEPVAMDISFGYCSDQNDPFQCGAWNQSVATVEDSSTISTSIFNVTTGSIRLNSSRFFSESDWNEDAEVWEGADAWLCENGSSGPEMTCSVSFQVDGESVGTAGAWCDYIGNGSSLGVTVESLLAGLSD